MSNPKIVDGEFKNISKEGIYSIGTHPNKLNILKDEKWAANILGIIQKAIENRSYEWTGRKSIILYVLEDTEGVVGSRYIKVNFEVEE